MTQDVFWAGVVAPLLGAYMLYVFVNDLRQGRIEAFFGRTICEKLGLTRLTRDVNPNAFGFAFVTNAILILILLVVSPLWAFTK